MPGTELSALHAHRAASSQVPHVDINLPTSLWGLYYCYSHFAEEESEVK